MIREALCVGIGGGFGAVSRFVISQVCAARFSGMLPVATLGINLSGSLLLGILAGASTRLNWSDEVRLLATTGFLGGFTTFSAFSVETLKLLQSPDSVRVGIVYIALSVAGGIVMAAVGWKLGSLAGGVG